MPSILANSAFVLLLSSDLTVAKRAGTVRPEALYKENRTQSAALLEVSEESQLTLNERLERSGAWEYRWPFIRHLHEVGNCVKNRINVNNNLGNAQQQGLNALYKMQQTNAAKLEVNQQAIDAVYNQMAGQTARINANGQAIAQGAQNVAAQQHAIAQNAQNIAGLGGKVGNTNAQINANLQNLQGVEGAIKQNLGGIQANQAAINQAQAGLAQNAGLVNQHQQAINGLNNMGRHNANAAASNANRLNGIGNQMATNAQNAQANAQAAGNLGNAINQNAAGLASGDQVLGNIGNALDANGNRINQNIGKIGDLSQGVNNAANAAGQNANAIASNAQKINGLSNAAANQAQAINNVGAQIGQNVQNIGQNAQAIGEVANTAAQNSAAIHNAANQVANQANAIGQLSGQAAANANAINNIVFSTDQVAANANAIASLSGQASRNAAGIAVLTEQVGMLTGTAAVNSAAIAGLSVEVATLTEVAAPTIALANTLGLPVNVVSSLSLAGSFVGPLLGCVLLVHVCWPQDEKDLWPQMEQRVARLINDAFNEEHRTRLSNRLKRYLETFAACAHAWAEQAMPGDSAGLVTSLLEGYMTQSGGSSLNSTSHELRQRIMSSTYEQRAAGTLSPQHAPPCMSQLEGHMALERDEWMWADKDSLSSLFMPFANMHTQLLTALKDYPIEADTMEYDLVMKARSAEYANFMLDHLLSAWKKHVCRTMRLRHSMKNFGWRYQLVVLAPVWQPNAGESCLEKCAGSSGWCNFCGGVNVGACCQKDGQDSAVCRGMDIPGASFGHSNDFVCVHNDCIQSNSYYYGSSQVGETVYSILDPSACQKHCFQMTAANVGVFNFQRRSDTEGDCRCFENSEGLYRQQESNWISGPVYCPAAAGEDKDSTKLAVETESLNHEKSRVPMTEITPCEKSVPVSNIEAIEADEKEWLQGCFEKASRVVTQDFNPFYQKFSKFIERLAWMSGCGDVLYDGGVSGYEEDDWEAQAPWDEEDTGATFGQCEWNEKLHTAEGEWVRNEEEGRGWTGTSRINLDEQAKMQQGYPMPKWLARLKRMQNCLYRTATTDTPYGVDSRASMEKFILSGFS
eukprot:TRINITY_DN25634_c0_g1_i1.p1 TRINITY_DN25634_c0_g1~~TRINITY_DN25634_c0_g1_i1.p1  ORF type:complete len:1088 (+),score=327.62 TRINITY_DN25634_c0_g1_i1:76-3339(+)